MRPLNTFKMKTSIVTFGLLLLFVPVFYVNAGIEEALYKFVVGVFGWILGVSAAVLDYAVNTFVIGFGAQFDTSLGVMVDTMWVVIRDFFNLTFIFGLVYLGFTMILNSDNSNTRRWLVTLIMAALLVNFSLFISKFVVDVSNLLATQVIQAGLDSRPYQIFALKQPVTDPPEVDFAASLMQQLNVVSAFGRPDPDSSAPDLPTGIGYGYIFGLLILLLVASFVFFSAGLMLIIRAGALLLFMVLSPAMFIGWVIPSLNNITKTYWKEFLGRAFFAPLYLLMTFISLAMFAAFTGEKVGFSETVDSSGKALPTAVADAFGPFVLIIFFLVASLVIGKKLGADGAGQALKIGANLQRGGRKMVARNTAGAAARGVARGAEVARNRYDRLDSSKGGRGLRTAMAWGTLGLVSDKNVRGALGAATKASVAGSETLEQQRKRRAERGKDRNAQADIRERQGQRAEYEATGEEHKLSQAVRNSTSDELVEMYSDGKGDLAKPEYAKHMTDAQIDALEKSGQLRKDQIDSLKTTRNEGTFANINETLNDAAASVDTLEDTIKELGDTVRGMSNARVEGLGYDRLKDERVAANLTDSQVEHLEKSDKYSATEIKAIKSARENGLAKVAKNGSLVAVDDAGNPTNPNATDDKIAKTGRENLFKGGTAKAGKMPATVFKEEKMAPHITPQILEERLKNGVVDADLSEIRKNIDKHINKLSGTERERQVKIWKQWEDKSSWGSVLALNSI